MAFTIDSLVSEVIGPYYTPTRTDFQKRASRIIAQNAITSHFCVKDEQEIEPGNAVVLLLPPSHDHQSNYFEIIWKNDSSKTEYNWMNSRHSVNSLVNWIGRSIRAWHFIPGYNVEIYSTSWDLMQVTRSDIGRLKAMVNYLNEYACVDPMCNKEGSVTPE